MIEGYTKIKGNRQEAEQIVDDIMQTSDPDGNGVLDYSEYLMATADKQKLLAYDKLRATFNMFD